MAVWSRIYPIAIQYKREPSGHTYRNPSGTSNPLRFIHLSETISNHDWQRKNRLLLPIYVTDKAHITDKSQLLTNTHWKQPVIQHKNTPKTKQVFQIRDEQTAVFLSKIFHMRLPILPPASSFFNLLLCFFMYLTCSFYTFFTWNKHCYWVAHL